MKKILLILVLGISTNVWSASELNSTCDLWEEKNTDLINFVVPQIRPQRPQDEDLVKNLKIYTQTKDRIRVSGNGFIISETLTNGISLNLKRVLVSEDIIIFQTRRSMRWSMTGSLDRNTGALDFRNYKEGKYYIGTCEIKELS